ncbi:DUF3035 domain-containing protein [Novosphingobium album (ex Liu et al. 2023)]|uniref:DUF3035 domain-containing protein n=1 Tax=Novosphingobium album (ex Liu et al. 2023) TaxID=3031130 RepID=A0ABT5WNM7_9SPHN|nr:DUF3035 domain-containing protein [Novosphingobium album (ex Liu et al. 2023)]MDE8651639.1 DUF3035 domain-containing protein [Novosphingobium album (ex Liu et al. 2023)]
MRKTLMAKPAKARLGTILFVATGALLLSGCGSTGGLFNRDRPDEFAVQRQTPLVVPPDFSLTPPKPGEPRPYDRPLQQQTLDALFGGPSARSEIETRTLGMAGTAAPAIRSSVGDFTTNTVAKGQITRQILAAPEGDGQSAQTAIGG